MLAKPRVIVLLIALIATFELNNINMVSVRAIIPSEEIYPYHNYSSVTKLLRELEENYSDIVKLGSIGKTWEGRDIWLVKISDNVEEDEKEPEILLLGAHHGNEKLSFEVLIYFIQYVVEVYHSKNLDNDKDGKLNEDPIDGVDNDGDFLVDEDPSEDRVREIVNSTEIYIIPIVNPDGVEAYTRKNREPNYGPFGLREKITSYGVDLNRNYGYRWLRWFLKPWYYAIFVSQLRDKDGHYRGEKPFSENETKAIKNFMKKRDIRIALSYHGYMGAVLYPWWYTMRPPIDEMLFRKVGREICKINGYKLYTSFSYLGYRGGIGTAEDWLYGRDGVLAFCIELEYPQSYIHLLNICKKHVGVNIHICEIAKSTRSLRWYLFHLGGIAS